MIALLAIALSLASTNDYLWTTGAAPYEVVGIGTGPSLDYTILRGEDPAFLFECFYERNNIATLLSSEDDSRDIPIGSRHPFPSAVPCTVGGDRSTTWFTLCDAGWSYANTLMRTNGTPCNAVFDRAKTISSMKKFDRLSLDSSYMYVSQEELTNIYTSGRANFEPRNVNYTYRSVHYGPTNDVYSIRPISSVITNLYLDFDSSDALQFSTKRIRGSGGYTVSSMAIDEYSNYAKIYRDGGFIFEDDRTTKSGTTNTSPFVAFAQSYTIQFTGSKRTASAYDGQSLKATERGTKLSSTEEFRNPIGTCAIEFHHSLSNHIEDLDVFCLYRVSKEKSWPTNGKTGQLTNEYNVCWVVERLGDLREIERKPNGARRFSFMINMPSKAIEIIQFVGYEFPDERVLDKLVYRDPLGPISGASYSYLRTADTDYSTETITVTTRELIGVAKLRFRTRILKQ